MATNTANTTTQSGTDIALNSDDLDNSFDDEFDDLEEDNIEFIEDETGDETDGEDAIDEDDLEPDETDDDESDDEESDDEESDDEDDNQESDDDALVDFPSGEQVTLGELKQGYMRQNDYSRKLSDFGERTKAIESQGETLQNVTSVFAEFIAKNLPPEPDQALALSDPSAHYQQKVLYDNAVKQLNELIGIGEQIKRVNVNTKQVKDDEGVRQEQEKLRELYPAAFKNAKAKQKFFSSTFDAASKAGFSDQEIRANDDHRLFVLAHKANLYDQLMSKSKSNNEVKTVQKPTVKKFRPFKKNIGARNKIGKSSQRAKSRERLMRDDSIENAAALLSLE